jgi:hypothetical protein
MPDNQTPPGDPSIVREYDLIMVNGDKYKLDLNASGYIGLVRTLGRTGPYSTQEIDVNSFMISAIEKNW